MKGGNNRSAMEVEHASLRFRCSLSTSLGAFTTVCLVLRVPPKGAQRASSHHEPPGGRSLRMVETLHTAQCSGSLHCAFTAAANGEVVRGVCVCVWGGVLYGEVKLVYRETPPPSRGSSRLRRDVRTQARAIGRFKRK